MQKITIVKKANLQRQEKFCPYVIEFPAEAAKK